MSSFKASFGWMGWTLVALVAGAVFLFRCQTAMARGIYHFDEAYYLLETKTFKQAFQERTPLLNGTLKLADFKKQQMAEGTLFPPGKATPVYSLLLILLSLFPI